jgi:hypothetical protein
MLKRLVLCSAVSFVVAGVGASSALAEACSASSANVGCPGWEAVSDTQPSVLPVGGKGTVVIQPLNVGATNSAGEVTVIDTLPAHVTASDAGELDAEQKTAEESPVLGHSLWDCTVTPGVSSNSVVSCHNDPVGLPSITGGAGAWTSAHVNGGGLGRQPRIGIAVNVAHGASVGSQANVITIAGGGAVGPVTVTDPFAISSAAPPFGFARWSGWFSNANGTPDTLAGSVPYSATFSFDLNDVLEEKQGEFDAVGGEQRNIVVELPPGFVGNPTSLAQCKREQLERRACPQDSQVGFVRTETSSRLDLTLEVFNMVPPPGVAAEFAFPYEQINVFVDAGVRSGADYGVRTRTTNAPERQITAATLTLWGVPGDPSHNVWRRGNEGGCTQADMEPGGQCNLGPHPDLKPFLRLPTSCAEPQAFAIWENAWLDPETTAEASFSTAGANGLPAGFAECGRLPFEPSISSEPSVGAADSPSGLDFDLHVPQPEGVTPVEENDATTGAQPVLHESDLKDAMVTFPAGLNVNPSEADGLQVCSEAEVGFMGFTELDPTDEPGVKTPQFTPDPAECPDASKLGTVEVDTPLIGHPLLGSIYLAAQSENPFGSLLAVYITVDDPISGVVVKLPGHVEIGEEGVSNGLAPGQLRTVVDQDPQVPFEDFKIDLFEGSRSAFTTPATCGTYTTTSLLTPWSGTTAATPSSSFDVTGAPGGGACPTEASQEPNDPAFSAGTVSPVAGAYSPFVLHLGREDGSQKLRALNVTLPDGLIGKIAGVERCPQADIEAAERRNVLGQGSLEQQSPSCPVGSEVGLAHVGAGSGAPFYVTGRAYLAGPYEGAPFSLVVITPAVAGPFDLGTVVVRSALFIDASTAQVTVKSDPFPSILDGIPLDIRSIEVEVTRPQFTLNPTSCARMAVTGSAIAESSQATISSPFQVGGGDNLPFKPDFTVSTNGRTSKASGASLGVRVTAKPGEANIAKVDVQLPTQLPARLTTLQKACTEAQFDTNPAGCPAASDVATAVVHTSILNAPLSGPAYFVSHGGAAFPDLEVVLQGEGVTIVLIGHTNIKDGVTYSKFESIPDAPFSSFELNASQGAYSILTTNLPARAKYSLCGQNLYMPTTLIGQNGATLRQTTKVSVQGCGAVKSAKAKKLTRAQLLARALKSCRKKYKRYHNKRARCERQARKRFALKKPAHKTKKPTGHHG